ncbi:DUF6250 domain-containing protein [Sphingobium aquiterrae]|uniref:DUF6250 domain-containing protein n=1 Tax=Sphingobium aquiterrae TaxID=2038656 RepID=UPI00301A4BD8
MSRRTLLMGAAGLSFIPLSRGALARSAAMGDDFRNGLAQWDVEAEAPARVAAKDGVLDIDTPEGVTLWFRRRLTGPVRIDYDVMAVAEGGANDAVSDVNAFWMAHEAGGGAALRKRSGAFADYDDLRTYYVGIGGNRNSTTRFRRYVGRRGNRPLLPEHDRGDPPSLLQPNRWTHVRLIADGRRIAVERDGQGLFALDDRAPYRAGYFGLRTTKSHLRIRDFQVASRAG